MRVAFVINSLGAGGTERSTAVLLPHLRDRGIDPEVICLVHRDEGDEQAVRDAGFPVHLLEPAGTGWRGLPARVRALRRLLRQIRPDVVHTAIFEADVAGRLAVIGTGVPVLSSLVNTPYARARLLDPNVERRKLEAVRAVDALTARLSGARFHAVTAGVADDAAVMLRVPRERITVVERGRDPESLGRRTAERRAAARAELGVAPHDVVVLTLGRQEYQKGQVYLVEAVARLARTQPRVQLYVAGRRGNASADLERAIERHGVADRVHLLGHRANVAELLVAADVFVLPSLYEGTAGAAIEAMALEVPIVATDLPGTRGLLVDGTNAWLVPMGEATLLAGAITDALGDAAEASRRTGAARAAFEDRFTLERSAAQMVQLYDDVARSGGRS